MIKKHLFTVAFLFILSAPAPFLRAQEFAPAVVHRKEISALQEKAIKSTRDGDLEEAIRCYQRWSELEPENPLVLKDLMWGLWQRNRFDEAETAAHAIIKLRRADFDALDMLARVPTAKNRAVIEDIWRDAVKRGEVADAPGLPMCRKLVALAPKQKAAVITLHFCHGLYNTAQYKEGLEAAQYLVSQQPDNTEYLNLLGKAQEATGDTPAALKTYTASLGIKPNQPAASTAIAAIYVGMREFKKAKDICLGLDGSGTLPQKGYPLMAISLFREMRYADAGPWWEKAVQAFPAVLYYKYFQALNLSMMGQEDEARSKMLDLYEKAGFQKAFLFLIDDDQLRGELAGETALLEREFKDLKTSDEPWVRRMTELYERTGETDKEEKLLARFGSLVPESPFVWGRLCGIAFKKGNLDAAEQFCKQALAINPYVDDTYKVLAEIALAGGRTRDALQYYSKAAAMNPTYPENVLGLARFTYEDGHHQAARAMVMNWLKENKDSQVLPILLYHGLTAQPNDTMLAYPFHHSVEIFDAQLKALHDNGYSPVTQAQVEDWLAGKSRLPEKPVLITFDDGRLDSFALGDPVLQKYGLKAVMFSALVNAEGTSPGYLSLDSIRDYKNTGRWEIQSHGDIAHINVPTDHDGVKGLFLVNRSWLDGQGRMETLGEWRERIDKDYLSSRVKLETAMRSKISGFAYPQGDYGQQDSPCNTPEAARTNQALVRKYFSTAYIQDSSGLNTRTQDPWHMTRIEPNHDWRGEELLRHFGNDNPFTRSCRQLLEWSAWEGRTHEATSWLEEMKKQGSSRGELLAEAADIHLAAGDMVNAFKLAGSAAELEKAPVAVEILSSASVYGMLNWTPTFNHVADNQSRRSWAIDQTLQVAHTGSAIWSLRQVHGEYRQDSVATAVDNGGGVGIEAPLNLFQRISGELLAHAISGKGASTWSGAGTLYSTWTDEFKTQMRLRRALYSTARAINSNITVESADAAADWDIDGTGLWKASAAGMIGTLSDSNSRFTAGAGISCTLPGTDQWRGIYRATYDNMRRDRTDIYYSPKGVIMNSLGAELTVNRPRLKWTVSYLPALTFERGAGTRINQEVNAALVWHAGRRLDIRPAYSYFSAGSYSDNSYSLEGELRF